jgi:hypothetical protein
MSLSKKIKGGFLIPLLLVISTGFLIFGGVIPSMATGGSSSACATTSELLDGAGFRVTGLRFRVTGLGFRVTGLRFRVTGLGVTAEQAAQEIADPDNQITPQWLIDRLLDIQGGDGFNQVRTAVLVVDDFSETQSHGNQVRQVFDALEAALPSEIRSKVDIFNVDVSGPGTEYETDAIADRIDEAINGPSTQFGAHGLRGQGYEHFVINMSFGLLPCQAPQTVIDGTVIPAFDFHDATETITETLTVESNERVTNFLECVVDNHDGTLTAHFGYDNPNGSPVTIPYNNTNHDQKNYLSGGGLSSTVLRALTPRYFARPNIVEDHPGRSAPYPNSAFQVVFNKYNSLTWNLFGNRVTASKHSPQCSPDPYWEPELKDARHPDPDFRADLNPFVECVADNGDGTFTAHFGYENKLGVPFFIPASGYGANKSYLAGGGLSAEVLRAVTPRHFGTPNIPGLSPARSAPFPNSAFQVIFNGTDLEWELYDEEVVASAEDSPPCLVPEGYGMSQYFTEVLGVPDDLVDDYMTELVDSVGDDELAGLTRLLEDYLDESKESHGEFAVIPVAAAGNFRDLYGPPPTRAPALSPAITPETIAVAATLGNDGPLWRFSHDGNVLAPGAGFEFAPGDFGAGTSFAAPFVSMVSALWLTYPDACEFDRGRPPLVHGVSDDKFDNASFSDTENYPLDCSREDEAREVEIDVRPHIHHNFINLNSHGVVPVAILSSHHFDATTVDPESVLFAGASPVSEHPGWPRFSFRDVNSDHKRDLVLNFRIQELELQEGDREAELVGETFGGQAIHGVDRVIIIPRHGPYLRPSTYPVFRWVAIADSVCYQIQLDNDRNFGSPEQTSTIVQGTVYNAFPLRNGRYYWRVRVGGNCLGVTEGPWSQIAEFRVGH